MSWQCVVLIRVDSFSLQMGDISPRSSLRDVSQGGMSATQQQKFHTDVMNQCLHKKFGSHGVPNGNLFNFTFLLVDFGKVLCSSTNELQKSLRLHLTLRPFVFCLSFVNSN